MNASLLLDSVIRYGSPIYLYDESIILSLCSKLKEAFSDCACCRLLYAMKANSNPYLLNIMLKEGFGVDVVSIGELLLSLAVGFQPDKILYTGFAPDSSDIATAVKNGVTVNIESLSTLEMYCANHPYTDICLRLNTGVGAGFSPKVVTAGCNSKFGLSFDDIASAKEMCSASGVRIIGVHSHSGSNIYDPDILLSSAEVLMDCIINADLVKDIKFIDFGGGFGVPYVSSDTSFDIFLYASQIKDKFHRFCQSIRKEITLIVEPGRFLVAESGVLLAKVTSIKHSAFKNFVCINTGFNHLLRPAMYGACHDIQNVSASVRGDFTKDMVYDVVGNICESGDTFAVGQDLGNVMVGDILVIKTVGAYGFSMASHYNTHSLPCECLVKDSGDIIMIRKRESPSELVNDILHRSVDV